MTEGGRRVSVREGDVDTEAQMAKGMMSGRVQAPRNAGGFQKLGKARNQILPWSLQKECGPADTLIL